MVTITTQDIEITVKAHFMPEHSIPKENHYFYVYFISITNKGSFSVQLLRRHWDITDSNGEKRSVEGEGVVGETPVIEPGQTYHYNSGCNLLTDLGYMEGYYTMKRLFDDSEFNALIPRFSLMVLSKLN